MARAYERGSVHILDWLHRAEEELINNIATMFNGETGKILEVRLDDAHGLCFTFDKSNEGFALQREGPGQKWYPVSTIKLLTGYPGRTT